MDRSCNCTMTIGQRQWGGKVYYVAQLPTGKSDWGWTTKIDSPYDPAIHLSQYWQRRFLAIKNYSKDPLQLITLNCQ